MKPPMNTHGDGAMEHWTCLLRVLPDRRAQIERSYRVSSDFREICDDYADCVAILETIAGGSRREPTAVADYEEMRERLEQEIREWLASNPL
ncbi:MAG: hypothetical protein R3F07_06965 [Opitutaceae bacterium]